MKIEVTEKVEKEVVFLKASCGVRYWDDGEVNGKSDDDGKIPCREGDLWCPLICLKSGIIMNWECGVTASVHYKVCDDGSYALLDKDRDEVISIDGYVPAIMCPEGGGYGDYVIMRIDEDGRILNWKPDLSDFEEKTDD